MGVGAADAFAQAGARTKAASLVQHGLGSAHLAVVVRGGDDRDAQRGERRRARCRGSSL